MLVEGPFEIVRDFKIYLIFDASQADDQNNWPAVLGVVNTLLCLHGRNLQVLGSRRVDRMMQGSKGPALNIKPHKGAQTLRCLATTSLCSVRPPAPLGLLHPAPRCLTEGFFILQGDARQTPQVSEPERTRYNKVAPSFASAESPRTHMSPSVRSTQQRALGAPRSGFGGMGKVTGTPWKRANYFGTIWLPVKLPDSRPGSAPPSSCFGRWAAGPRGLDNPKPVATNRSRYLLYSTIFLVTKWWPSSKLTTFLYELQGKKDKDCQPSASHVLQSQRTRKKKQQEKFRLKLEQLSNKGTVWHLGPWHRQFIKDFRLTPVTSWALYQQLGGDSGWGET